MSDEDNDELWPRALSPSGVYVRTYYCNKCRKNHLDDEGIFEEHRDYARKHLMPTGEEDTGIEVKRRLMLMGAAEREGTEWKSAGLFEWISKNQPDENHEFAHGWWRSMEFLQLLAHDFANFEFDVISSFAMETPPPTSTILMPLVSARLPNLEIIFKESWVLEPNYTVSVKWGFPEPLSISTVMFWSIVERIDPQNKWLLEDFPGDQLYERYYKGSPAFSGSVKNQHLLYALFHILYFEAGQAGTRILKAGPSKARVE